LQGYAEFYLLNLPNIKRPKRKNYLTVKKAKQENSNEIFARTAFFSRKSININISYE
jgi:hypothetical protein